MIHVIKRRIFSILANLLAKFVLKIPITDYTNGFRIYSKNSIKHIVTNCGRIGDGFIIECKGRANESFPIRWKLFKKVVNIEHPHVIIYKPQNHKECDKTVELILEQQNS